MSTSSATAAAPRAPVAPVSRPPGPPQARPPWRRWYAAGLVVLDAVAASVAALGTLLVRFGEPGDAGTRYAWGALAFPVLYVLCATVGRAYEERYVGEGTEEYRRIGQAAVWLAAGLSSIAFGLQLPVPRGFVVVGLPAALGLSLVGRSVARALLRAARARGHCVHHMLLVGSERSVAEMVRRMRREGPARYGAGQGAGEVPGRVPGSGPGPVPGSAPEDVRGFVAGYVAVGACLDRGTATVVEGVPVVGTSRTVIDALWATGADTVAVTAWSILSQQQVRRLCWELEGSDVDVLVAPAITDVAGPRIHIRPVAGLPLLHVEEPEFRGARRIAKATFDRVVALSTLVLLLPVLLALGLAVRLTSRGPALFRQRRVGQAGSQFTMYKFRTMYVDAERRKGELATANEAADGVLFKIRHDPRVTRIGAVLRRYSVDELPQLINVIRGDMSLVGPRPPLPDEVARYPDDVHRRLLVKPGLTGLWQVSGRSDLPWEEAVRLDLDYVENWSVPLDIAILWRTASAVLASRGAY